MEKDKKLYQEAKNRIIQEIGKNEQYNTYFSKYSPGSVKNFIESFARHKAHLEVHGDYSKNGQKRLMEQWNDKAWVALRLIQNKKLFDLACLWHAEEVCGLPMIEISEDFSEVQDHILDYNYLPDVTKDELEMYIRFLKSEEHAFGFFAFNEKFHQFDWIKDHYREHSETGIPYFDYHNTYTGNQRLLSLPNIREEKESEYLQLGIAYEQKKNIALRKHDEAPYLDNSDDELIKFARQFNDLKTAYYIQDYNKRKFEPIDLVDNLAINYLDDVYPETVAIKTDLNWKDAVLDAAIGHFQKKVCEVLPSVYQEYLMKKDAGISITPQKDKKSIHDVGPWIRDMILKGRELKGEPRDFNF